MRFVGRAVRVPAAASVRVCVGRISGRPPLGRGGTTTTTVRRDGFVRGNFRCDALGGRDVAGVFRRLIRLQGRSKSGEVSAKGELRSLRIDRPGPQTGVLSRLEKSIQIAARQSVPKGSLHPGKPGSESPERGLAGSRVPHPRRRQGHRLGLGSFAPFVPARPVRLPGVRPDGLATCPSCSSADWRLTLWRGPDRSRIPRPVPIARR